MLRKSCLVGLFFAILLLITSHQSFADYDSFTVNVPNPQGGYVAVVLKKSGDGYVGPNGEYYSDFPTVYTLQSTYGVPDYVKRERMLEQQADQANKANMQREIEQQKWADQQMQESIHQQNARMLAQQKAEARAEQEAQEQAQEQAKQATLEQQREQVQAQQQAQQLTQQSKQVIISKSVPREDSSGNGWVNIFATLAIIGFVMYFIPSIVAYKRKHRNFTPILLVNIFLGWTFLGWVVALIWSFLHQEKREVK